MCGESTCRLPSALLVQGLLLLDSAEKAACMTYDSASSLSFFVESYQA